MLLFFFRLSFFFFVGLSFAKFFMFKLRLYICTTLFLNPNMVDHVLKGNH